MTIEDNDDLAVGLEATKPLMINGIDMDDTVMVRTLVRGFLPEKMK